MTRERCEAIVKDNITDIRQAYKKPSYKKINAYEALRQEFGTIYIGATNDFSFSAVKEYDDHYLYITKTRLRRIDK